MKREDKIALVERLIRAHEEAIAQYKALASLVGSIRDDAPLWTAMLRLDETAIEATASAIGDEWLGSWGTWLEWYIYDNDCGAGGKTATAGAWSGAVRTVADLVDLIEADWAPGGE